MVSFEPNHPPPKSSINIFFDIISPYSYFAFTVAQHYAPIWRSEGYAVHYIPVYQGGIMHASRNVPPMTVPAKGRMSSVDSQRWAKLLGVKIVPPARFPVDSLACGRLLAVIARYHGPEKLALAMAHLWRGFWGGGGQDIASVDDLRVMLSRVFTGAEIDIMLRLSRDDHFKDQLKENTKRAVTAGAFGCPWIEVQDGETGTSEYFFGNDRWIHICRLANIRWDGYAIVGGGEKSSI